ncbi:hypothetical protein [Hymenobacter algoricola]|uniref:hypothetical protein n=1 Tax=Hymenobacter algoricola TaxID=486267 RepID=UPI0031F0A706
MLLAAGYARPATAQEMIFRSPYANFSNVFNCFPNGAYRTASTTSASGRAASAFSENGVALTPRGELRVLVIYAGFTNDNVEHFVDPSAQNIPYNNDDDPRNPWPQTLNGSAWGESLPRSAAANFYTSASQFSPSATDQTLSNFYYQMSQFNSRPFKLTALNFPVRVNVTATNSLNYAGWDTYSSLVMDRIRTEPALQAHMAGLSRAALDARTNRPQYLSDNSLSAPDDKIDYTIIIWRYAGGSPGTGGPNSGLTYGLENVIGSGGGYAAIANNTLIEATGSTPALTTYDGFTQCLGIGGIDHQLFTHEFAHTLYYAPHVNGNNGVSGDKYYVTTGNSMTTGSINAWERWFLGWAPLQCNGVSGDLTDAPALVSGGRYRLRDFITTGDALRIRLPNTYNPATGTYQYLWLENHQKLSIWDQRQWTQGGAGQPLPVIPAGMMAYVEDMRQNKNNPTGWNGFDEGANGLKYLSAAGHYDLAPTGTSSTYNNALWGNLIYDFSQGAANPTGGQSNFMFLRGDKDYDGQIDYTTAANGGGANEYFHFAALNGTPTYGFMGNDARYRLGAAAPTTTRLAMDSNPALVSTPSFDAGQQRMAPMQLSGVSVQLTGSGPDGSLYVQVSFTDTDITRSTRWTGSLRVSPVPGTTNGYDVNVLSGARLSVNRSGTPNRTTPGPLRDFINDTYLAVAGEAQMHLETGAALVIGSGSTVYVENGGRLLAEAGSVVRIQAGGLLSVKTQAEAEALRQYDQLDIQPGGQLQVRDNQLSIIPRAAGLSVYPNPTQGPQVRFELTGVPAAEAATYTYRLLTPYGQPVRQGHCAQPRVSLVGLPAGTYLLELTRPGGQRLTRRVQVNP